MNCEQAELHMAELLAEEISPEDRMVLDQHLLDCASCRSDFELARAGSRVKWFEVSIPRETENATLGAFRQAPRSVRVLRWATAAAALVGVAILLLSLGRTTPTTTPEPVPEPRPERLAMMQDAVIGSMVCKDEDGRPVGELGLRSHEVSVEIVDGIAKTTVEENYENHTDRRLEGSFQFPLPSDASISRLALEVNGKIEEGTCLERERAREVFEGIVRRMKDPALLEWQPGGFFTCRVFPIEPRATKRVIVAYTQALPYFRGRMTYVYPLASEKTRAHPPGVLAITVRARFSGALAKIESPSHHLDVQRRTAHEASLTFRAAGSRPDHDFVLTMEPADEEVRVVAHRPEGEDGYFACFVTPRGDGERTPGRYAFVIDASASITAPRLEVVRRLVRAMMERRIAGDRFEIIAHNVEVEASGDLDLPAANRFLDTVHPIGGSDVLKALLAAGDREIIYIGKGAPTFGETDPSKILDAVKGLKIRTIAVGSDANGALLEKLGGMMRVNPNDDVDKRVAEIAATLGSPVLSDVTLESEGISDVVGARDLFYGERLVLAGRFRGAATKLVLRARGWRREVPVTFPAKEEANNYVRRLWAQRKVADLLAQGPSKKAEVTELGVKYQIMTPYTSFLVLENEQMWKDHQLKREVQKQDEVTAKAADGEKKRMLESEAAAHEIATKRQVMRRMAELLQQSYEAWASRQFDRTIKLCDDLLAIDPHYIVANELKTESEKLRRGVSAPEGMADKIATWKRLTEAVDQPVIPWSQTVRFPSREEWAEISKRIGSPVVNGDAADLPSVQRIPSAGDLEKIAKELARGRSASDQHAIYESQSHYEQALMLNNRGDFEKAKIEAQKAVEAWYENMAARKLLNDVNRITVGGRPELGARSIAEDARDDFRVRVELAQIEITKHVRDGERYLNARMYDQAAKEFENAEFKIENIPYEVRAMNDLLPLVKGSLVKARNARILEGGRAEVEKKWTSEAETGAKSAPPPPEPWEDLLGRLRSTDAAGEQAKAAQADELYRQAERSYQAGDFEKSLLEAKKVLQMSPNHAPARALYTEEQFILGQLKATPATEEYDGFMRQGLVRHQQLLVEVDGALARGQKLQQEGRQGPAEAEFRKVLEFTKWMPTGVEVETRRRAAADLLSRSRAQEGSTVPMGQIAGAPLEELNPTTESAMFRIPPRDLGLVSPAQGGGRPLTGATFDLAEDGKAVRIDDLGQLLDVAPRPSENFEVDLPVIVRQLEVQLAQIQELTTRVDEQRSKFPSSSSANSPAVAELQYARQRAERLQQDLTQLEEKQLNLARGRRPLEEKINAIAQSGANVNVAPKKALDAKVTAIATDIGLLVISVGKDDGVLEGDEFMVYHGGDFVAKIVIDRADRKWSAGRVVLKKSDPEVGDDVSNHIYVSGPHAGSKASEDRIDLIRAKMGGK